MSSIYSLDLPERRRNYRFSLTPLADAMFQLLIFFMLSSGLTPYSLLPLQSAPAQAEPESGTAQTSAEAPPDQVQPSDTAGDIALWTIEAETVIVGGQSFGFDALDDLAGALGNPNAPADIVLIVRPSAQVQDITTVLASLSAANIGTVQVSAGSGF